MPEVSLVQLADHSRDAAQDVMTNGRTILKSLKAQIDDEYDPLEDGTRMIQWIEDNCKVPQADEAIRPLRVHAEAGLMALLKKAQGLPPLGSCVDKGGMVRGVPSICVNWFMFRFSSQLDFVSEMQDCAIGVSKKCCYMCYLLGEYLFEDAYGMQSYTAIVALLIYSW